MPAGTGAEAELLLASARAALYSSPPQPRSFVADGDRLLRLAERNGLVPLLHRFTSSGSLLPPDVAEPLAAAAGRNARAALATTGRLRALAASFAAQGVAMAAYKGPALAVRAYGDPALRRYADLDLLVAPDDVPAASAVLEAHGYQAAYRFTPPAEALFRRVDGDYPFHHPGTGALVELHARVSSLRFCAELSTPALLACARPVRVGGGPVPALADEDLFLALALHGAKHRWSRLEWLASAGALLVRGALPPAALVARGAEVGARRAVLLALRLLHDDLALPLPAAVERMVDDDLGLATLARESRALWFADAEEATDATAANLRYNLRLRDGTAARVRFALRWLLVPSPEDWAWVSLPPALFPLYRLLRPIRLCARYAPWRRR
jgi:hypothetical protein